ncbi:hypothetical protein Ae168Ps1_4741 [Pseudonocardia sp. Ae168_Ps1]|nr:hypothetical protein Ae168Ps1_4741 [Pseudonocardia sp. Ae168_Ps1]
MRGTPDVKTVPSRHDTPARRWTLSGPVPVRRGTGGVVPGQRRERDRFPTRKPRSGESSRAISVPRPGMSGPYGVVQVTRSGRGEARSGRIPPSGHVRARVGPNE